MYNFTDGSICGTNQVGSGEMQHEREQPRSQRRKVTGAGRPEEVFLLGQALLVVAELLARGLVHVFEVDPIKRYLPCHARPKPVGRYSSFLGTTPRESRDSKNFSMQNIFSLTYINQAKCT